MIKTLKAHRATIDYLFKFAVVAGLGYLLYTELYGQADAASFWQLIREQWEGEASYFLWLVAGLMPLNWGLEAQKWRVLLRPFWRIGMWQALRAVTSGVVLSLFTPNRVGDYGGRVLAVPASRNWQAVLATLAGNIAQLIALLTGGLIGMAWYLQSQDALPSLMLSGLWWLVLLGLAALYLLFLNLHWLSVPLRYAGWLRKRLQPLRQLEQYGATRLLQGLLLALLRYSVYCLQYYFILRFFGINAPFGAALSGIATIFLVQASVPLPPLAALLARGEAALLVWAPYSDGQMAILAATFGLFIINLCLPSLFGIVFILKTNVLKSLGYEQKAHRPQQFRAGAAASHGFHDSSRTTTENNNSR